MSVPEGLSRRRMLLKIAMLFNGIAGVLLGIPIVRYILSPITRREEPGYDSWVSLGPMDQFPSGETRLATYRHPAGHALDGETADIACWVRHTEGEHFQVFAINCAHLGCPVRWFPQSGLFLCPCHGGAYYADGSRAPRPPERGLFAYDTKIVEGALQINAGQMPTLSNTAKLVQIENAKGGSPCAG